MVSFHVLRCAFCETFQVLQVTKTQKWKCKLCGQKQSILKVYGEGTGAECRHHVQKLNTLRGQIDQHLDETRINGRPNTADLYKPDSISEFERPSSVPTNQPSRWTQYVEDDREGEETTTTAFPENDHDTLVGGQVVTTDRGEYNKRKRAEKAESHQRKFQKSRNLGNNIKENFAAGAARHDQTGGKKYLSELSSSCSQGYPPKASHIRPYTLESSSSFLVSGVSSNGIHSRSYTLESSSSSLGSQVNPNGIHSRSYTLESVSSSLGSQVNPNGIHSRSYTLESASSSLGSQVNPNGINSRSYTLESASSSLGSQVSPNAIHSGSGTSQSSSSQLQLYPPKTSHVRSYTTDGSAACNLNNVAQLNTSSFPIQNCNKDNLNEGSLIHCVNKSPHKPGQGAWSSQDAVGLEKAVKSRQKPEKKTTAIGTSKWAAFLEDEEKSDEEESSDLDSAFDAVDFSL